MANTDVLQQSMNNSNLAAGSSPAKNIFVYRNGDTNFQCKRIVVNPRQIKNFDAFIELITARVKAKNGAAVRRVFTPTGRTKVTELSEIENNHFYVAAGAEGFQRHEYNKISGLPAQRTRLKDSSLPTTIPNQHVKLPPIIKPVQHSRLKVSARCRKLADAGGNRVIYVFRNGDDKSVAVKLLFTKYMLKDYEIVLEEVTRKVKLIRGAVHKLCTLEGRILYGAEDFVDREFYVACGKEKFVKVPYPKDGVIISPRATRPPQLNRKRITRLSKDSNKSKESPQKQEQKQAKSTASKPTKETTKKPKAEKTQEQKEAEEVFHSKPAIVKRSREKEEQSLDFSEDPEGVFKAKEERAEIQDAAEVEENQATAIDLPIDQVVAEEVDDEEIKEEVEAEPAKEPTTPTPEQEPESLDKEEEQNKEEQTGFYSKRSPVTSNKSPIIAATDSPTGGSGGAQSPNDNNNNNAENNNNSTDNRESPLQNGGDDANAGTPSNDNKISPSPEMVKSRSPSPNLLEEIKDKIFGDEAEPALSPHPPTGERSATYTPKSSRRTQTPKDNRNSSAKSREVEMASRNAPTRGRESQNRANTPKQGSAPPSPATSNRKAQTPQEDNAPKPDIEEDISSSSQLSERGQSAPPSPTKNELEEGNERSAPSSGNPLVDNSANQAAEAHNDEELKPTKRDIENRTAPLEDVPV